MNDRKHVGIAVGLLVLFAIVTVALADSIVVDTVQTPGIGTAYSDPIRASGWLDRVELVRKGTAAATTNQNTAVVIATYDGTTALTTYATVTFAAGETTKTVRPRVIGQTNAGVNLAAVESGGTNTSTTSTQILVANYEPLLLGGNMKMKVTTDATNDAVRAVMYFSR